MTPGARLAAAIEVLDLIRQSRAPADGVLKAWGREHRYAGSGDRRAIAERVYTILRARIRLSHRMGDDTGRALILGALAGLDRLDLGEIDALFIGGHCPEPLSDAERAALALTEAATRLADRPDPVPDELITRILQAGACAPNGGNTQKWRLLVLKDPKIKKAVQVLYKKAFDEVIGPRYASSPPPPGITKEKYHRQHAAVEYLTEHFHEAPVWIVACLEDGPTPNRMAGASIYPAVQNMILATRALGLGTTLTTRHMLFDKEADAAMGLPDGVHSYAILPIGYPMGKFGPVGRGPMKQFVYQDKWGQPYDAVT